MCVCFGVFQNCVKMAARHSKDERQRLKNMLSDAIRVLCQNTVRYNAELSIQAVIGLTIDGGTDTVVVSMDEQIGKHSADTTFGEEPSYDVAENRLYSHAEGVEDESLEYLGTEDDEQVYDDSGSFMPGQTMVKEELMSTITYGNVGLNQFQPSVASSSAHYKTEPYIDNGEQYYDEQMDPQNVGFQQGWPSAARPSATIVSKSRMPGAQKRKKPATLGLKKLGRFAGKASMDGGGAQRPGMMQSLNGQDEVAQITLYTCGTCGAQMQSQASFQRHKRSHTGQQACRCEGCGKTISRHDNLLTHQRRCLAYLSLAQHSDLGL